MTTKSTTKTVERNGIRRPTRGKAAEIWEALDGMKKDDVSFKSLGFVAEALQVNERTLAGAIWRYRKFHG